MKYKHNIHPTLPKSQSTTVILSTPILQDFLNPELVNDNSSTDNDPHGTTFFNDNNNDDTLIMITESRIFAHLEIDSMLISPSPNLLLTFMGTPLLHQPKNVSSTTTARGVTEVVSCQLQMGNQSLHLLINPIIYGIFLMVMFITSTACFST